jgi:hypothetical protein
VCINDPLLNDITELAVTQHMQKVIITNCDSLTQLTIAEQNASLQQLLHSRFMALHCPHGAQLTQKRQRKM